MKLRDALDNLLKQSSDTRVDIAEIRKDLNYHIRRTDMLEESHKADKKALQPLLRGYAFLQVSALLLASLAALAGIARLFL